MRLTLSKVALYLAPLLLVLPVRAQNITTVAGNSTWNVTTSVRLDAAGNLYAPDYYNHVVYKVDSSGNTTIVAGTYGKGGFAGDGALASSALLDTPTNAVPAPDGTLYIVDSTASRIRKVAPNGIITTYAGTGTAGFKGDGGPAGSAEIRTPGDILIDASGNILFSDAGNARVRKITPAGIISTVAGFGTATYSGDGFSALQAGISPNALGLGTGGSFYIVDSGSGYGQGSQRVRMVAANGIITTVAGNGDRAFSGDGGQATSAGIGWASGVTLDSGGNLYISESSFNRIRKVSPDGTITTYAGIAAGGGFAGDGGPALDARLYDPQGLAVDSANNLYVADGNNHRIRKISGAPAIVSNGLVNAASFAPQGVAPAGVVPGEIATIFGVNLTTATGINFSSGLPLPTKVLNVQVLVNGTAAPIFAVDNVNGLQQINFQVPTGVANSPTATVQVVDNGAAGNTLTVPVISDQPGMFTYNVGGSNFGAILHPNSPQLADTGHPASAGETVVIFCTGLGAVVPAPQDGAPAPGAAQTTLTATVTIGGVAAAVDYAGLSPNYVGLYQINAHVPTVLSAGNQPVVITVNGIQSAIALLPVK
jgi:uncharacterized protein (TIGR03437 family)